MQFISLGNVECYLKLLQLPKIGKIFAAIQIVGHIVQMYQSFNILVASTYFGFFLLVEVFSVFLIIANFFAHLFGMLVTFRLFDICLNGMFCACL